MLDFDITDSNHQKRRFLDVIGVDTVIVSHAVDPLAELPYYQYLNSLGSRVVLIISKENPLIHIMMETHGLSLDTYTDHERSLLTHLKEKWSLKPDTSDLVRQLRFQILFVKGQMYNYWMQPCSEQWKHFMSDREAFKKFHNQFGTFGVQWLREQDKTKHDLWCMPSQRAYGRHLYTPSGDIDLFMKLYHLMPNRQLETELNNI